MAVDLEDNTRKIVAVALVILVATVMFIGVLVDVTRNRNKAITLEGNWECVKIEQSKCVNYIKK